MVCITPIQKQITTLTWSCALVIGSKELDEALAGICSRGEQRRQRYRTLKRRELDRGH
jgi:hypothetical protein